MPSKVTWLGHGAFWLETGGHTVLIDPFLSGNPAASTTPAALSPEFILISHGHGDHVGDCVDIARRSGATCIANFEIANWLSSQGVQNTHGQHIGGGHQHPFGYLKLTIAHHGSGLPDGSYGGNPAGFLLTATDGKKIYFACDTGLFYEMQFYGDEGVDLAFLPIGDNFTMGPDDALRAVKLVRPGRVVPVHYNTWELIAQDANAWSRRVEVETQAEAVVLKPGESVEV